MSVSHVQAVRQLWRWRPCWSRRDSLTLHWPSVRPSHWAWRPSSRAWPTSKFLFFNHRFLVPLNYKHLSWEIKIKKHVSACHLILKLNTEDKQTLSSKRLLFSRCIKLQFGGEEAQNEAWTWLAANQLSSVVNTKESRLEFVWVCCHIFYFHHQIRWSQRSSGNGGSYNLSPPLCPAPQMRRGDCWPPTWTGIPLPTLSTTAVSSTSCCHMTSLCPTGWSSPTRCDSNRQLGRYQSVCSQQQQRQQALSSSRLLVWNVTTSFIMNLFWHVAVSLYEAFMLLGAPHCLSFQDFYFEVLL